MDLSLTSRQLQANLGHNMECKAKPHSFLCQNLILHGYSYIYFNNIFVVLEKGGAFI